MILWGLVGLDSAMVVGGVLTLLLKVGPDEKATLKESKEGFMSIEL